MREAVAYIYVAGPLSAPTGLDDEESKAAVEANVARAIDAGLRLMDEGLCPYVPHLSYFMDKQEARPYEAWMALDFAWISRCCALLRLPGHSPGADREVAHAKELGIPVFNVVEEVIAARVKP